MPEPVGVVVTYPTPPPTTRIVCTRCGSPDDAPVNNAGEPLRKLCRACYWQMKREQGTAEQWRPWQRKAER